MIVTTSNAAKLISLTGSEVLAVDGSYIALFDILTVIMVVGGEPPFAVIQIPDSIPKEYGGAIVYGIEQSPNHGTAILNTVTGELKYYGSSTASINTVIMLSCTYSNGIKRVFPLVIQIYNLDFDPDLAARLVGYV